MHYKHASLVLSIGFLSFSNHKKFVSESQIGKIEPEIEEKKEEKVIVFIKKKFFNLKYEIIIAFLSTNNSFFSFHQSYNFLIMDIFYFT